jgi:hypothetical protein
MFLITGVAMCVFTAIVLAPSTSRRSKDFFLKKEKKVTVLLKRAPNKARPVDAAARTCMKRTMLLLPYQDSGHAWGISPSAPKSKEFIVQHTTYLTDGSLLNSVQLLNFGQTLTIYYGSLLGCMHNERHHG